MITLLAHRLCDSSVDDLTMGADVTELLLHLPELAEVDLLVHALHGVLDDIDLAEWLVALLLPSASFDVVVMLEKGQRVFAAAVDTGRGSPFSGFARSRTRALLAAAFRAYEFESSADFKAITRADNTNAPATLYLVAEAAE